MKNLILALLFTTSLCFAQEGNDLADLKVSSWKHQDKNYLVVQMTNQDHWHTYWKNPGDSGLANKFKFLVDGNEIILPELPWPTPFRFIESNILWTNGYEGENTFFFELPATISGNEFKTEVTYLICKDICIPGKKEVSAPIRGNEIQFSSKIANAQEAFDQLPHETAVPENLKIYFNKVADKSEIVVHFTYTNFSRSLITSDRNILYPHKTKALIFKHEELFYDIQNKTLYGRIEAEWAGAYEEPELNFPIDGVFSEPIDFKFLIKTNDGYITSHVPLTQVSLSGEAGMNSFYSTLEKINSTDKTQAPLTSSEQNVHLFSMILFAILGGLILNFMPCVLPIISLKLFGLIKHSNYGPKQILKHNLAYTAGILFSFSVLSTLIILLKNSGEKIGWGFQLQSPIFLMLMIVILFIFALNLFGLYEFRVPGSKFFGNVTTREGFSGDFSSGVLAVILSTPCSAPFLGTALAFAFTTTAFFTYVTFLAIGVGLASPFLLTAFFPKCLRLLPKPGAWMEYLKYFMGLSLIATVIWLLDVLILIVGSGHLTYFLFILSLIFFAFFILKKSRKLKIFAYFLLLGSLICLVHFQTLTKHSNPAVSVEKSDWKNFTPDLIESMKNNNQTAFIDFTAKWCITCQVNKKLVLETADFLKFCQENKIELVRADWTNRDDSITNFLSSYQIFGIPAYFLVKDGKIKFLGETITTNSLRENL